MIENDFFDKDFDFDVFDFWIILNLYKQFIIFKIFSSFLFNADAMLKPGSHAIVPFLIYLGIW